MSPLYITLFLTWLSHFFIDSMIGIWAVYKTIAGLDLAMAGFIAGISALIGEGLQILFGSLSDRGHRRLLIGCGLIATTACAFVSYTQNYILLFCLFLITCIGSGAFHPAAAGLVSTLSKNRKNLFMAIFASGGSLGLAFSQMIFSSAYEFTEGDTAFLAILPLCLVLFLAFYGLTEVKSHKIEKSKKIDLKVFGRFFKFKPLRNLYLIQLLTQSVVWGTIFFLPDLLTYREYPEWIRFGGAHFYFIMGAALTIIPGGYLADLFSAKKVLVITQVCALLLFYALLALPTLSPILLCVLLFFLGTSFGLIPPLVLSLGNHMVPSRPGMVSAFLMGLVWCVAEGIGQGGGGLLTKVFADNIEAKTLAILGVMLFGSLFIATLLPEKVSEEEFSKDF